MRALRICSLLRSCCCMLRPPLRCSPTKSCPMPKLEQRARNLSRELRCMVCQNQSIDDSDAPLARDLRLLVRERLKAGDSNKQVLDFLTARYGDFVLLKPPLNMRTASAVGLAGGILVVGGIVLFIAMRRRRGPGSESSPQGIPLTAAEQARIDRLLDADPRTKS